jgi:hypothetical protein
VLRCSLHRVGSHSDSVPSWKRRYEKLGEEGLTPRSCRRKVSTSATHVDVAGWIVYCAITTTSGWPRPPWNGDF